MQLDVEESTPASDLLILPQNCNWQLPSYYYLQHVDNILPPVVALMLDPL